MTPSITTSPDRDDRSAKAKHSDGPWLTRLPPQVARRVMMPNDTIEIVDMNRGLIACLHAVNHSIRGEVDEANAHLIAAAPDLLAALKAVVAVADRKTDEFDLARAAIAKAEGR